MKKFRVEWGMTPTLSDSLLKDEVLGSVEIEANSLTSAKRKAKLLANSCEKIRDIYRRDYTRSWVYWENWGTEADGVSKVFSSDCVLLSEDDYGRVFISLTNLGEM